MAHAWKGCSQRSRFLLQARRIIDSGDENANEDTLWHQYLSWGIWISLAFNPGHPCYFYGYNAAVYCNSTPLVHKISISNAKYKTLKYDMILTKHINHLHYSTRLTNLFSTFLNLDESHTRVFAFSKWHIHGCKGQITPTDLNIVNWINLVSIWWEPFAFRTRNTSCLAYEGGWITLS